MADPGDNAYGILGLQRGASQDEIRSSWKRLIIKTHPDKNGGDDAAFRKVQGAYETLCADKQKTPEQRRRAARDKQPNYNILVLIHFPGLSNLLSFFLNGSTVLKNTESANLS